ncbi:MAG TPA: hypothetical protein VLD86_17900 [Ilumatobacteraceae bacterium]|nr:hypothetical protein [Ilumatobacteraceae bacterium]
MAHKLERVEYVESLSCTAAVEPAATNNNSPSILVVTGALVTSAEVPTTELAPSSGLTTATLLYSCTYTRPNLVIGDANDAVTVFDPAATFAA